MGQELRARPLDEMFANTGVDVRIARVTGVDADRKTVSVTDQEGAGELAYDTLVYALGSAWNPQDVPGAAGAAHEIAGRPGALRLRERLAGLAAGRSVVVVGGGLTGLEAASEIAEARPDLEVSLTASGGLGDWLSPKGRRHLRKVFAALGVRERRRHGRGRGPRRHRRRHGRTGRRHGVDHRIRRAPPGEGHHAGRHRHGPHRGRRDHALGVPPGRVRRRRRCAGGGPRREAAADVLRVGRATAWQAADAIAARLTGGKLPTVTPRYFNQCISLGRGQGLIQYVTADDRAVRGALTGRLAAVYKELVCKSAAWGVANPTLGIPTRRRPVTAPAPEPAPTV
ncbi:FAD-dependent oxidoreductase [Streptomyces violaceorubidus]